MTSLVSIPKEAFLFAEVWVIVTARTEDGWRNMLGEQISN